MELLGATSTELQQLSVDLGQPAFRGKQIAGWIYKQGVLRIEDMTDLPKAFRSELARTAPFHRAGVVTESASRDGTRKFLLQLRDGQRIESVLLPYTDRTTACISTQVGCAAACAFCASGELGLVRNLSAGEIVDQILTLQGHSDTRISNVVYMGVGEPLLNYDDVLKSIRLLNEEVGIAARHITLSTVGVTPRIVRLAEEDLQITLAVSLHAPDDALRRKLMPLTSKYPLRQLINTCRDYANKTGRRVTMEYLLLADVNDSPDQAKAVAALLRGIMCNVNLIPYNHTPGSVFRRPDTAAITAFRKALEDAGLTVTQRYERGDAVAAACGQLRSSSG